jgi:hypothetical protein
MSIIIWRIYRWFCFLFVFLFVRESGQTAMSMTPVPAVTLEEKPLPKIVVIMGAGSSADFGVPTLRSIFKDPAASLYLKRDIKLHNWLQQVFWRPRGHNATTSDKSLTIEEMLTIIRDWQSEDKEAADLKDVDDIRRRLYILIYHAVYLDKSSKQGHFNGLIDALCRNFSHITWASFNWDCIFEASYWYNSGPPASYMRSNPGLVINLLGWRPGSKKDTYLKLHGSVNWWQVDGKPTYLKWASHGELMAKWKELEEGKTKDSPIILEPSAYKYEDPIYLEILKAQWEEFFGRLLEADCVLVLGYSLPDNDPQARCKILTAFQVNKDCEWAVVDPTFDIRAKYERLLGWKRLTTFDQSLAGFGVNLEENLRTAFPNVEIKDKPVPRAAAPAPATTPSS